jgi:hypothetical protein
VVSDISFTSSGLRGRGVEHGHVKYYAELTAGPIVRDFVEAVLRYQHNTEYTVCDMGDHVRLAFTDDQKRPSGSDYGGPARSCAHRRPSLAKDGTRRSTSGSGPGGSPCARVRSRRR